LHLLAVFTTKVVIGGGIVPDARLTDVYLSA